MTCLPFPQHMFQSPGASPEVMLREEADACRVKVQVKKPQKNGHGQAECKCQFPLWCRIAAVGKENALGHAERAMVPKHPGHGEVRT